VDVGDWAEPVVFVTGGVEDCKWARYAKIKECKRWKGKDWRRRGWWVWLVMDFCGYSERALGIAKSNENE
jgi:hypothetical protein